MTPNNSITLNWVEPISISDLVYHNQTEIGVYIWGFTIDEVFIPYYVGFADHITFRMHEHLNSLIGGKYTICHRSSLTRFMDFKSLDVQIDKAIGKVYEPNWPKNFKHFLDNRKELQPHIDFMVDTFAYTYALVGRGHTSTQYLKEVEKICINQIGKENLSNTRAGSSNNLSINHTDSKAIVEKFIGTE